KRFDAWLQKLKGAGPLPAKPNEAAGLLIRDGILTQFQAEQILQGKWRRFTIGKYKVLERLGAGGMGSVYLCEHKLMRRRVAVKVLPTAKAQDDAALQRFYREARAVAALDHPNIVHAYDIDQDDSLHFLVMEYVDGSSLQDIVKKAGPMDIVRACHYIRQAAQGLEHAHDSGLIHRDIKPGNILIERSGVVKILDMGLARFFNDDDDVLTKKFDENVLGTADYLAPEQAIDSHEVDIRADIYSLGATFYYMLTGRTPFGDGTVAQKLLWHQTRHPKLVTEFRPEVSPALATVIAKMMNKDREQRYQTPAEVSQALEPFTQEAVGPPPDAEMPQLSLAAVGPGAAADTAQAPAPKPQATPVPRALQGMSSKASPPSAPTSAPTPRTLPSAPPPTAPAPAAPPAGAASAKPSLTAPSRTAPSRTPASPAPKSKPKPVTPPASAAPKPAPAPLAPATAAPAAAASTAAAQKTAAPTAVAAETPSSVDEEAPWESLSSVDTEDPSNKADTSPSKVSSRTLKKPMAVKNPRRAWMVFGLIGTGVSLVVGGLLIYAFRDMGGPPPRKPLDVTRDASKPNSYRSVLQALRNAEPGDVIYLHDAEHFENLLIEPRMKGEITTDVTIQAAPGAEVVWRPYRKEEVLPILTLQGAVDFKIRGQGLTFDGTLDGKKRVNDLIVINFESAGLAIEDATLKGFGRSAVNVVNVWGRKGKLVRLINLTTITAAPERPKAGLLFEANPDVKPPFNDFIEIADVRFEGIKEGIKKTDNTVVGNNIIWPK
ncbi:MAG: protein kinase, partial [Gemmataceae bacterium]|nr:protein kinase [Gemmataceae bacterium]